MSKAFFLEMTWLSHGVAYRAHKQLVDSPSDVTLPDVCLSDVDWHAAGIGVGAVHSGEDGRKVGIFTLERIAS